MDTVNQFLIQPNNIKYLGLLPYLVYFMLLFHLPYLGIVLGSSALSTAYAGKDRDTAGRLVTLGLGKIGTQLVFGLLPPLALAVLYAMLLPQEPIPISLYLLRILPAAAAGLVLLELYRRSGEIRLGAAGVFFMALYCFFFIDIVSLLLFPGKWPLLKAFLPYPLYSITPLIHFAAFACLSLAITGAAVLFFYYRWPERTLAVDAPGHDRLKYIGFTLLPLGTLLMPPVILWDLYTLPGYSLSTGVFVLAGLSLATICSVVAAAAYMIKRHRERPRFAAAAAVLVVVLFGLSAAKDLTLQGNALQGPRARLHIDAQKAWDKLVAERQERYGKNLVVDAALGETIYNSRCTACHSFTEKVLGPPFNRVLPKYAGKTDELVRFISNPGKVDPNYPAMPNPGLTPLEVKSTVKFLAQKMGWSEPGEKPAEQENRETQKDEKNGDKGD